MGYVGLPTAVAFAEAGFAVLGADINAEKVRAIKAGRSPLPDLVDHANVARLTSVGRFDATTEVQTACSQADIVLLVVPTPVTEAKQPDLRMVEAATASALRGIRKGQLVVLESTTYPGTTDRYLVDRASQFTKLRPGADFGVAYCPERFNPGDRQHLIENVHRVLGAIDGEWASAAAQLYGILNGGRITIVRNLRTAEAAKVIENIQRDINIALVNEFALIFERLGIDTYEVLDAAATKWNFVRYNPGPGVGGHCLPVDPYYLTSIAEQHGYHPKVILAGREVNDAMPGHVVSLLTRRLNDQGRAVRGTKVAVLGLAYKANTGDARESPAEAIVDGLRDLGALVRLCDPLVPVPEAKAIFHETPVTVDEALREAQAVVLVTDHEEFRRFPAERVAALVAPGCCVVDARRAWEHLRGRAGLDYYCLGRVQP